MPRLVAAFMHVGKEARRKEREGKKKTALEQRERDFRLHYKGFNIAQDEGWKAMAGAA